GFGAFANSKILPLAARPLVRGRRKLDLVINVAVHALALWDRSVGVHDDFGIRIQLLDGSDEAKTFGRVALRVFRISYDERKLGNDVEVTDAPGEFECLLRSKLLVHLLQHPVGAGFRSKENHFGSGAADRI